jgi:hypothetical protein
LRRKICKRVNRHNKILSLLILLSSTIGRFF